MWQICVMQRQTFLEKLSPDWCNFLLNRFSPDVASKRGLTTAEMNAVEAIHQAVEFNPHVPKVFSRPAFMLSPYCRVRVIALLCDAVSDSFKRLSYDLNLHGNGCCQGRQFGLKTGGSLVLILKLGVS